MTIRWLGVFSDASYVVGPGTMEDNAEAFASVKDAKRALVDRYESNGHLRCEVKWPEWYADGTLTGDVKRTESVFFPAVTREARITLYALIGDKIIGKMYFEYPTYEITLGIGAGGSPTTHVEKF